MRYCAYFCEENVWHLCREPSVARGGAPVPVVDRRVIFVSNPHRSVLMRHQRAGRGGEVQWDYHVVLFALGPSGWEVWDHDCALGMPLPLARWLLESFPDAPAHLTPRFRVVEATRYLALFSSDRSHMFDAAGVPQRPPPPWPPILVEGVGSNLLQFVDMELPFEGEVLDMEALRARFGCERRAEPHL